MRIFLMAGGYLLLILGLFAPWLRLYTSFGDSAGEHSYGPWSLLSQITSVAVPQLLVIFIPLALLVVSSVASLVMRSPSRRVNYAYLAAFLAIAGAAIVLLFLVGAPDALALMWPYYTTRGVEYGAWAAIAGFACIGLSALAIVRGTPLETPTRAA
jgi:hypothetical protein